MVASFFGLGLISLWKKMEPVIHALREFMHAPFFLSHFKHLVKRLSDYRKEASKT
jgi:hypothetical protein